MATTRLFSLILFLATTALTLTVAEYPSANSLAEIELQQLRLKRELLQSKLSLLEQSKAGLTLTADLPKDGIDKLVTATTRSFQRDSEIVKERYDQTLTASRRERAPAPVQMGERRSFEFPSATGDGLVDIVDYIFIPIPAINEGTSGKELQTKDLILVLLADNSVVAVSIESGRQYLWFDLDMSVLEEGDTIVDFHATPTISEPFFILLTKKGKVLIHHYTLIESAASLRKYRRHLKNNGKDESGDICRDRLQTKLAEVCRSEDKKLIDDETKDYGGSHFVAITNIEQVDLPKLIKNETKVEVGPFDEETVEFKTVQVLKQKNQNFFVFADSTGYLTTLVQNLRLKSRIYSDAEDIVGMATMTTSLLVMHPQDVAFTQLATNDMSPIYCEASFTGSYHFESMRLERYRTQQNYIYALNSNSEIVIFEYKYKGGSDERNVCHMVTRLAIPEEFSQGEPVGFATLRGSLMLQSSRGTIMLIETSNEVLLQTGQTAIYTPFGLSDNSERVEGFKVIEAKAPERNIYMNTQSTRFSGSYVAMRAPGGLNKLVTFEYNSSGNAKELTDEEGSTWLNNLMKPLLLLLFMGLACYVSYNSAKNRKDKSGSNPSMGGGKNSAFRGGSSSRKSGFRGLRK